MNLGSVVHSLTTCSGHPASLTAFSSIHLFLRSCSPACAEVIKGFEELLLGRNRCGRSHSGMWRIRYSMQASRRFKELSSLEDRAELWDKNSVEFRIWALLKPRCPSWVDSSRIFSRESVASASPLPSAPGLRECSWDRNLLHGFFSKGRMVYLFNRILYQFA